MATATTGTSIIETENRLGGAVFKRYKPIKKLKPLLFREQKFIFFGKLIFDAISRIHTQ